MAIEGYEQIIKVDSYTDLLSPLMPANAGQLAIDMTNMVTYQFNGTTWNPLGRPTIKLSTVTVNAMAAGTSLIYTLEDLPVNFVPTQIVPTVVAQTGTVITPPVMTVGTNATNYDNIAKANLLSSLLSGLTGVGGATPSMASSSPKLSGGAKIYAKVSTAAIGPTVLSYNIDILGYLKT